MSEKSLFDIKEKLFLIFLSSSSSYYLQNQKNCKLLEMAKKTKKPNEKLTTFFAAHSVRHFSHTAYVNVQ